MASIDVSVGAPFSDHNSITFSILGSPYERRESHKLNYSYANANWAKLRDLLCYIPWHCAFLDDDIDNNWTAWSDLLFTAIDECIPKRKKSARRHAPWITNDLIKLCRRKKSLYKKAKKWGRVNDWTEYCALNNSLKKACNSALRQHIQNIAQDLQIHGNPKSFWSYVSSIRKGSNDLVALKENNTTLMDDLSIAESMNSYFSAVFTSESFTNFPVFNNVVNSKLLSIVCNANEISDILKNLNAYKSPGPDHLPPRVLKECAVEIAPSLCKLMNASFTTGSIPHAWKQADIVPIHKKGPKTNRENYRQVSLTSIACKVCEKIVKKRVVNFWHNLGIFNPIQFGFLEGKSTVTQLLTGYNDWASSRNKSTPTDVIFLDFTKAFDSVPHERLLLKLKGYGIEGNMLQWFRNFLTNRQQRVVVRASSPRGPMLNPEYPREQSWDLFYFSFMLTIYHLTYRLPSKCSLMTQRCTERSPISKKTLEPFKRTSIVWRTGQPSGSLDSIQRNANRCV